jgi:hypothetical protein
MLLRQKLAAVCPRIPLMKEAHMVRACTRITAHTLARRAGTTSSRDVKSHPNTSERPSSAQETTAHTMALENVTGYAYMEEEVLVVAIHQKQFVIVAACNNKKRKRKEGGGYMKRGNASSPASRVNSSEEK